MTVDPQTFRATMSAWASGVAVVTTSDGTTQAGLTVSAFTSLSLLPPLILVCIDRHSSTLAVIRRAGSFAVNILAEDQADISQRFASRRTQDKFAGAQWHSKTTGAPILDTALAWLDCELSTCYEGGDHLILIGQVLAAGTEPADSGPLLYYRSAYHQFEKAGATCQA
jgi:3-hydroxy-9,10-secoandrosta-1,3,5(10)-triene-9,17-dione monooxygenase reductase component